MPKKQGESDETWSKSSISANPPVVRDSSAVKMVDSAEILGGYG
jgi:hypothetical protein